MDFFVFVYSFWISFCCGCFLFVCLLLLLLSLPLFAYYTVWEWRVIKNTSISGDVYERNSDFSKLNLDFLLVIHWEPAKVLQVRELGPLCGKRLMKAQVIRKRLTSQRGLKPIDNKLNKWLDFRIPSYFIYIPLSNNVHCNTVVCLVFQKLVNEVGTYSSIAPTNNPSAI